MALKVIFRPQGKRLSPQTFRLMVNGSQKDNFPPKVIFSAKGNLKPLWSIAATKVIGGPKRNLLLGF